MDISIKVISDISFGKYQEMVRTVLVAYGQAVKQELMEDKPEPPAQGTMRFKTERQRRFVMAMISQKKLRVPYIRGTGSGLNGSQTLNRSFRVDLEGDSAVLYSAASYAPYVVGDQQADIHKGRWKTAINAASTVAQRGDLDKIVQGAIADLERM